MDPSTVRDDMVDGLAHDSKAVLESDVIAEAMRTVPRHEFVEVDTPQVAYEDRALAHRGTTVLSPSLVARLLEAIQLNPTDEVLVVGAGVGYTSALLAEIVGPTRVTAIDLSRPMVLEARQNLADAGYDAVLVDRRDGAEGFEAYAPYDRILVEAAAVEPPVALLNQLKAGGRLVMPLGSHDQELVAIESDEIVQRFGSVRFKPLLLEGEQTGGIERNRVIREARERAIEAESSRPGWERSWIDWDQTEF